jgi:hypothetical protein
MPMTPKKSTNRENWGMGMMIGFMGVTGLADLYLTMSRMMGEGMIEDNPIVLAMVNYFESAWPLIPFKLATMAFSFAILWTFRSRWSSKVAAVFGCVVQGWLMGQWSMFLRVMAEIEPEAISNCASFVRFAS